MGILIVDKSRASLAFKVSDTIDIFTICSLYLVPNLTFSTSIVFCSQFPFFLTNKRMRNILFHMVFNTKQHSNEYLYS